jgi:hypothetical protein
MRSMQSFSHESGLIFLLCFPFCFAKGLAKCKFGGIGTGIVLQVPGDNTNLIEKG